MKFGIKYKYTLLALFIVLWWFLWPPPHLYGLDPTVNIDNYNLELYSTQEGLPQSTILALIQSKDGFIWLATYEGLARFDGAGFRVFDKSNTPAIKSNRIKALVEDADGTLWVGTSAGLLRYRRGGFRNFTVKDGLPGDSVTTLYVDGKGILRIGTATGLGRYHEGRFSHTVGQ
ncbi:MAG: hypothetical protein GY696_34475 [Gammaproteobacteria bacterium]|nr:hypothetical protein [Gammaproteobacteria bacterium]